ncbi:acyltransferase [Modestobacter sp. VKM Ac-2983]|uniref:acyltransferase n=1 Tax=Modestobacter sp. VKM Ac-2983 TaxID=3004137 RepID=UPI0022ABBA9E|nr:acyltransferase [Modestobacter sp. VKM Ac-2983]MCZ2803684.1 acyltransferase [Modestobacter sp. VKM Ac-2983]
MHVARLLHYYGYSHVSQRRAVTFGPDVALAPNVSFRNGANITVGAGSHIGERCLLWAGERATISLGEKALLGPEVFITVANYQMRPGVPVMDQPRDEADVEVGAGAWLGARVMVLPGVRIGEGAVVGAGSVVTRDVPANSIAVGSPARVVGTRDASVSRTPDAA